MLGLFDVAAFAVIAATIAGTILLSWPRAYTLGIGILATYAIQFFAPATGIVPFPLGDLALVPGRIAEGATLWSLATYAFLHGDILHIAGNLFILLTAGPALEDSTGPRWFMVIYAVGAIAAALTGVVLGVGSDLVDPRVPMVGASGAIFAVLTAFAVRHPRDQLPIILGFFVFWLPAMIVLGIYLAFNGAYLLASIVGVGTNIAWYGHFAGFVAGLALANRAKAVAGHRGASLSARRAAAESIQWDASALAPLGTTEATERAVRELERTVPGEEDVAGVWLDVLAKDAVCPACGGGLRVKGMGLRCTSGHEHRITTRRRK